MSQAGVIFRCSSLTLDECINRRLFGAPANDVGVYSHVGIGTMCFLLNISTKEVFGAWSATSAVSTHMTSAFGGKFPCQVQVQQELPEIVKMGYDPLIRAGTLSCDYKNRVQLLLDQQQVSELMEELMRFIKPQEGSKRKNSRTVVWQRPETQQMSLQPPPTQFPPVQFPTSSPAFDSKKRSREEQFEGGGSRGRGRGRGRFNGEKRRRIGSQQKHVFSREEVRRTEVKHVVQTSIRHETTSHKHKQRPPPVIPKRMP
eukprot:TRINITY_DN13489_c1_g1_i1.p3 TRINITY_DN13489_c1_g1~~TRINITY_DN13489_c1_g1_i1.p3  ORF type:complete len:258 (+),score=32.77 TRINITY_DN13489_c1_g1_i1:72-845(+)